MHPALVAPHLPEFAQSWCQALYEIRDNEEKDSAFRGLCTLVQANPAGMAKVRCRSDAAFSPSFPAMNGRLSFFFVGQSLLWFCNSIIRWNQPSPELNNMFQTLLQGFKQHDEAGWAAQVATFPPIIQERLTARYGV